MKKEKNKNETKSAYEIASDNYGKLLTLLEQLNNNVITPTTNKLLQKFLHKTLKQQALNDRALLMICLEEHFDNKIATTKNDMFACNNFITNYAKNEFNITDLTNSNGFICRIMEYYPVLFSLEMSKEDYQKIKEIREDEYKSSGTFILCEQAYMENYANTAALFVMEICSNAVEYYSENFDTENLTYNDNISYSNLKLYADAFPKNQYSNYNTIDFVVKNYDKFHNIANDRDNKLLKSALHTVKIKEKFNVLKYINEISKTNKIFLLPKQEQLLNEIIKKYLSHILTLQALSELDQSQCSILSNLMQNNEKAKSQINMATAMMINNKLPIEEYEKYIYKIINKNETLKNKSKEQEF